MHECEGWEPGDVFPAVCYCGAAGLKCAVDFFGAVETGGAGEEDADVVDGVCKVVVWERQALRLLV